MGAELPSSMNSNRFEVGGGLFLATSILVGTPEIYKQTDF